jgi:signal peptidase I
MSWLLFKITKELKNKLELVLAVLFICLSLGGVAYSLQQQARAFVVTSGSMEPDVKKGDVILTQPFSDYKIGDTIAFKTPQSSSKREIVVTHQIVAVERRNEKTWFVTKGSANISEDDYLVAKDLVIGKVVITIPGLGYGISFLQTPQGILLFVLIPCLSVILLEMISIGQHIQHVRFKD